MIRAKAQLFGKILVCLDGSSVAQTALRYAVGVADNQTSELILLRVPERMMPARPGPIDALGAELARVEAIKYLQSVKANLTARGLVVHNRLAEGSAAEQILQVADKEGVNLIVMATHGRRELSSFRLGGTAQKVVQHAQQSILLARVGDEIPPEESPVDGVGEPAHRRILVLLDGSRAAEASLVHARALAREQDAELILGHVATHPDLPVYEPLMRCDQELVRRLEERKIELANQYLRNLTVEMSHAGLTVRHLVRTGSDTRQGVLDLIRETGADFIVMASHGRTSSTHGVHGGLTLHLLSYAPVPILVVQNLQRHADDFDHVAQRQVIRIHATGAR